MPKLQEHEGRYSLCIPKNHIQIIGWQKGQELEVQQNGGTKLIIKEKAQTDWMEPILRVLKKMLR